MIEILYFSWIRERIGKSKETVETNAETIEDLINELCKIERRYALAFSDLSALRVALDQTLVEIDTPLGNAKEIAFFPPMTGG